VLTATLIPSLHYSIHSSTLYEGSGAAVVAVVVATTTLSPHYRIYQHIGSGFSLWILGLLFLAVDISFVAFGSMAVVASHVVAAVVGFVFGKQLRAGRDWGNWMYNFSIGLMIYLTLRKTSKN